MAKKEQQINDNSNLKNIAGGNVYQNHNTKMWKSTAAKKSFKTREEAIKADIEHGGTGEIGRFPDNF